MNGHAVKRNEISLAHEVEVERHADAGSKSVSEQARLATKLGEMKPGGRYNIYKSL